MFDNLLRQIKLIIYRLKRQYGTPVTVVRILSVTNNVQTGKMVPVKQEIEIRRAVVGPAQLVRDFVYDLSFIAANKNFTYGGYFDASDRGMIVASKDLPKDFEPNLNDYVLVDTVHYQFKEVHPVSKKYAWAMVLKQVDSIPTES